MNTKIKAKDSVDDADSRTLIRWTEEERELLKLWIIEHYAKLNIPIEEADLTRRVIMMAQLDILPEDRFRSYLPTADLGDMKGRISNYINKTLFEQIVAAHRAYVAEHKLTPIQHASNLMVELEAAREQIVELQSEITGLVTRGAANTTRISQLEAKIAVLNAQAPRKDPAASQAAAVPPKVVVTAFHYTPKQRAAIEALADVVWIESTHQVKDLKRLATGRHAFIIQGSCTGSMLKALRSTAESCVTCNAYNSLHETISTFAEKV